MRAAFLALILAPGAAMADCRAETFVSCDVGDVSISNARIRDCVGWAPRVSVSEGLKSTRAFYESRMGSYLPA